VPHDLEAEQELLADATARLVRTVDSFGDADWGRPSGLPGWTRAHVVAHLALNAEGLAGALLGVVAAEPTPMYRTQEARDADIEELSGDEPAELRARLMGACTEFADAAASVPADLWGETVERTPGGRTFTAAAAVAMRLREVEIHHADLDAGYTRHEWPPQFSTLLLDAMAKRGLARSPFTATPTDVDGTWQYGQGGPTVRGRAADLGWWVTGRGDGEGLTSDDGELPGIEAW
jgi:maleylpyruvate isomerase